MTSRIYTGILLTVSVGLILLISSPLLLFSFISLIVVYSLYEWLSISDLNEIKKLIYVALFSILLFITINISLTTFQLLLKLSVGLWLLIALLIVFYSSWIRFMLKKYSSLIGITLLYLSWLFLVNLGTNLTGIINGGLSTSFFNNDIQIKHYLLFLIVLVSLSDISGYFFGKSVGKKKLCPSISPNKTVEGFIGSIIIPLAFFSIYFLYYKDYQFMMNDLFFLVLLCTFCTIGDLLVSCHKRVFNKKDSGNILPGHGGVLDRLDSYLPCIIIYQYWMFM